MKTADTGKLLRIYIGESDRYHGRPLYEVILLKAKKMGLSGGTVIRAIQGFGAQSAVIHKAKILRLSEDLPILLEMVDTPARIKDAIEEFEKMIDESGCGALMTVEKVEIIRYHHNTK
jgi:PII-like signaling protein